MRQYIIDAFTDKVFSGNQAAVCVMDRWPEDSLMQSIAIENNFSETAFLVKGYEKETYALRWFTPGGEVDLCGHATLASAFVVFSFYEKEAGKLVFKTRWSGNLIVSRKGAFIEMDFPAYNNYRHVPVTDKMEEALGFRPLDAVMGRDLLMVVPDEDFVREYVPRIDALKELDGLLQCITAEGKGEYDCVSRCFGPKLSIPEDPVTGSAHCLITPYWQDRTGKKELLALQASARKGVMRTRRTGDRVILSGQAALFSIADIVAKFPV